MKKIDKTIYMSELAWACSSDIFICPVQFVNSKPKTDKQKYKTKTVHPLITIICATIKCSHLKSIAACHPTSKTLRPNSWFWLAGYRCKSHDNPHLQWMHIIPRRRALDCRTYAGPCGRLSTAPRSYDCEGVAPGGRVDTPSKHWPSKTRRCVLLWWAQSIAS